jgi:hypothetical protein
MEKTVARIAIKDISKHIREQNNVIVDGYGDTWVVTSTYLDTREQRRLNRALGISKANMNKK